MDEYAGFEFDDDDVDRVLIGSKSLPWKSIVDAWLYPESFLKFSEYKNGKVSRRSPLGPYGLITVYIEQEDLEVDALLPIVHKLDYANACEIWKLYEQHGGQLTVHYKPNSGIKSLIGKVLPHLEFRLRRDNDFLSIRFGIKRGGLFERELGL